MSIETKEIDVFERDENGIRKLDLEYGDFPDDGYDYSQHFAEKGNGIFIKPDGTIIQPEDREEDEIEIKNDIEEGIDPEILAILNGEKNVEEMEDDFLEKAMGLKPINDKDEDLDKEFSKCLEQWDNDEEDEDEMYIPKDFSDEEFDGDLEDLIDDNKLFKNGNPLDDIDFSKEYIEFDDLDVEIAMNSIQMPGKNSRRKQKLLTKKESKICKADLEIDSEIILEQAKRMEEEEANQETEKVIVQTIVREDIQTQPKSKPKPKNKPKMVKAPTKKKK